jgi:hypothetical protein
MRDCFDLVFPCLGERRGSHGIGVGMFGYRPFWSGTWAFAIPNFDRDFLFLLLLASFIMSNFLSKPARICSGNRFFFHDAALPARM